MKKIILLVFYIFISFSIYTQNYNRDVHQIVECKFTNIDGVKCNEKYVTYKFKIDTFLNWIIILDSSKNELQIVSDMDISSIQMISNGVWLYETVNDKGKKFICSLDEIKGTLHITPIYKIDSPIEYYSTFILKFRNPIKI